MYGSVSGADAFLGARIGGSTWLNQSSEIKSQYLMSAFDIIESLTFEGDKADADQENQFPRDDQTEVPAGIINAQYHLANCMLLQGVVPGQQSVFPVKRAKIGPVETEYFTGASPTALEIGRAHV